jgi:8-oxo-dGTP pyrophosphatase MutT (NUDIX family)
MKRPLIGKGKSKGSGMNVSKVKQRPMVLGDADKRGVRTQFGALCWRQHKNDVQIALITSRRTKRWILPKGWPVDGATPSEAAKAEAYEEAGLEGKVQNTCLGIYSYVKTIDKADDLPCVVAIFPMKVKKVLSNWPEKSERRRKWFSIKKASSMVDSPELKRIIRNFSPSELPD